MPSMAYPLKHPQPYAHVLRWMRGFTTRLEAYEMQAKERKLLKVKQELRGVRRILEMLFKNIFTLLRSRRFKSGKLLIASYRKS